MRRIFLLFLVALCAGQLSAQTPIPVMEDVIFYDGYAPLVTSPPQPDGILMHKNSLVARKMTVSELQNIGDSLQLEVVIGALCDNYDRIGNVNLALVPAGAIDYDPDTVQRIELGRFITPFFNKNIQPDTVPYTYNIDNITSILRDQVITSIYDIWIELELFGVPYAANTQVAGCAGRNDVFTGKLQFVTNYPGEPENDNFLLPLFFKERFNNYQAGATDTPGITTKSITFNLSKNVTDATLYLITSNHGANAGGEEYNRRFHYAYFDGDSVLTYKPGRLTCEPFRVYNTQPNGIYGPVPKTPAQWQSFSNWCPGDVIDIRPIYLDSLAAGDHTFMIRVPDAVFVGGEGNFPLSLYLQGKTQEVASGLVDALHDDKSISIYPNPSTGNVSINVPGGDTELTVVDLYGKQILHSTALQKTVHLSFENAGVYFVSIRTKLGTMTKKLIVKN